MARKRAGRSNPEVEGIIKQLQDEWQRRAELEPFWKEASTEATKRIGPGPAPPRPNNYGLSEIDADDLPSKIRHLSSKGEDASFTTFLLFAWVVLATWFGGKVFRFIIIGAFDAAQGFRSLAKI